MKMTPSPRLDYNQYNSTRVNQNEKLLGMMVSNSRRGVVRFGRRTESSSKNDVTIW